MWQTQTEPESNGRVFKIAIREAGDLLSCSQVLSLLRESPDFRTFFLRQLASVPFDAFRWETPSITNSTVDRYFECVVLNSPELLTPADPNAFADYFESHATDDIAVFPNLGNDATLVVPCPLAAPSAYGHLAAFLRNAPVQQQHALLKAVGQAMENRLSSEPVWLNTAGAGVSWLHVRLDSHPKYYGYGSYKAVRK